jgi:predicted CoA-substrate-specific enzyme activase
MRYIGLDAGSVSVKLAVLDEKGERVKTVYRRHRGQPLRVALELLKDVSSVGAQGLRPSKSGAGDSPSHDFSLSLTGSAGRLMGEILGIEPVNEVVAYAYANRRLYPHLRTIIELGGEDSKLIIIAEDSNTAKDFSMNSVCAAGTGSFLDQQAERLRLSIEEFSELSLRSKNPPRIAGRCSVFAKSDMIHLQQIATPVEDIVAGLCFAVARNFKGSIARGRDMVLPASFQGGVAANAGMIRAFREILGLKELFVPEEYAVMGAIGAALKDKEADKVKGFDLSLLERFIHSPRQKERGHVPLIKEGDTFLKRHLQGGEKVMLKSERSGNGDSSRIRAYLGVDIGSISTNLAVIDEHSRLLAKRYLMTAGRPIEAVKQGLEEIGEEIGDRVEIAGVGTTGSGRYMIADYIGADVVKNEITAQATAAAFIDKDVDTIFEIGGQDSKYISLRNGVIADFEMNKACAAGTGSFLEEQAEKLSIPIKGEFQRIAFSSGNPCRLGERCTVFMENSLMANLQRGSATEDLLAGLSYSIVQNYINRVVGKRKIGEKIFFQGGVAFNKSVVAAFEKYLDRKITVPPNHDVTGAIGMALIAKRHMEDKKRRKGEATHFKGFELSRRPYEISSFECRGCPNVCEINRVKVEGEKGFLFYGGRCEKYDVRKNKSKNTIPDLFGLREEELWKAHLRYSEKLKVKDEPTPGPLPGGDAGVGRLAPRASQRPRIGIPYVFYFHDFLPFWSTLLWELGFDVEVSPKTDRIIVDLGLESVLSETCFPVKTAHGHIRYLLQKGIDTIFLPSFVNINRQGDPCEKGLACPYTQTIPYTAKTAFREARFLTPVVDMGRGRRHIEKEISLALKPFGLRSSAIARAFDIAQKTQDDFVKVIKKEGGKILSGLKERTVVVVGRAYNSFDSGVNLGIPKKLADLGVLAVPMDFLPIENEGIEKDWPNMYWKAGQKILAAAKIVRSNPMLYAIYIGNFSCGPDSFIIKYFEEEMAGKPYLHLEIDAHSADAGAITRCEAFLDSIGNEERGRNTGTKKSLRSTAVARPSKRTVYIPRMSDHAFAIAAAFEYCGTDAEMLPESTKEAVELGKKYVSGKECYPCAVTTGDMVKKVMEPGFDPSKSAFFMPSGSGPCRFGQYNVFHKLVIEELGMEDVPIFAPNQDENFYEHLGIIGKDLVMRCWEGIVAIELLSKCLHETRPYEKEKGSSDALYDDYLARACKSIRGADGDIRVLLKKARADFEHLPKYAEKKPLIGIVGEIFVRSNRFSNEDLIRKVEALGCEAYLASVEEWLYYINYTGLLRVLIKKEWSGIISLLLKRFFQKRIEHRFGAEFEGFLRNLHEPGTRKLLERARPYIHPSFEGEAILSIGKSIDLMEKGAAGVLNAMPFGCMPGTIVSGLMRGINTDFEIPCLSIPYDGSESLTTEIQLEAFIDQAREYDRKQKKAQRKQ